MTTGMMIPMEHPSHTLSSNFPTNYSLDDNGSRTRLPLTDAAGNAQIHALASIGFYHDIKQPQQGMDRPMCPIPTLPSQPIRQHVGHTLEMRKQHRRRHRRHAPQRIPVTSPPYEAYRERAGREGNDDQKWPAVLEDAFLNALVEMPIMQRRKYSYRGKPHGRNEMIAEYLWIAYIQSLKPGQRPDESMRRDRKQVSSHIQVIKALFKGYPGYQVLFPPKQGPKNGFEDSFKDNPCLMAISEGRLPNNIFEYDNGNDLPVAHDLLARPTNFWLLITTQSVPDEADGSFNTEEDLINAGIVAHKFSGLSSHRSRGPLDSINNWQRKFPILDRLRMTGDLNCEVIHMSVSLNLMAEHPREGSELCCRTEMSIPGRNLGHDWRIVTTFVKPPELCSNPIHDPPLEGVEFQVSVISSNDMETRIKVPFPAKAWANAFTQLINIQNRNEERRRCQALGRDPGPPIRSVRDYVDQLSMYQEIRSSSGGPRGQFVRRAVILWTFHKSGFHEGSSTSWRYIDHLPPRRSVMSPSPHQTHQVSSAMSESYNAWADSSMSSANNLMDPFNSPPQHGLQPAFAPQQSFYSGLPFDVPAANMSFISTKTVDSESTLVDNETNQLDQYLSQGSAHTQLEDFSTPTSTWMPTTGSFEADPTWAYNVPVSAPALPWEDKSHAWAPPLSEIVEPKPLSWVDEATGERHDWNSPSRRRGGGEGNFVNVEQQTVEQRLAPWIEQNGQRQKEGFVVVTREEVEAVLGKEGASQWHSQEDDFDYAAMAERLK